MSWSELTDHERERFGTQCCGPGRLLVPQGPDASYGGACCEHDARYDFGGRELDRWRADAQMTLAMLHQVGKLPAWKRPLGYLGVPIYGLAVWLFGWARWRYDRAPWSVEQWRQAGGINRIKRGDR